MKKNLYLILWLSFFSFVIFGMWEFAQTPFFEDYTDDINQIIFNRFHCTLGDVLILLSVITIISIFLKNLKWLRSPEFKHYLIVSVLGVGYTIISEINNVYILKSWGYSSAMPTYFGIGALPIIQWILLPPIIMFITKNYIKGHYPDNILK
jgi:hypothetical protein